jgi:hypothetical protein
MLKSVVRFYSHDIEEVIIEETLGETLILN